MKAREKTEKQNLKARKARLKETDRGYWLKALQKEVNKFIRLRDKGMPCIACGTEWKPSFQASHFIPQGRSSFLRFNVDNIHAGCIKCNLFVGGGNIHGYRPRLVDKIGYERVEWLESHQYQIKKWDISELKEMLKFYRMKNREIENEVQD